MAFAGMNFGYLYFVGIKYKQYIGFHLEVTTITPMGKEDPLSLFFLFEVTDIVR